jgi:hypothetical protein
VAKRLGFELSRMLERVAQLRPPSPRRARSAAFRPSLNLVFWLPKPETGATDIAAGFIHWAWRLLGAGMKPVCYLTRLDRNPRREFRKREIFLFFSLVTL